MSDEIVQNTTKPQSFLSAGNESTVDNQPMGHSSPSVNNNSDNAFFTTANIRSKLDEVVHLCQFGGNVVALLGDKGVGKTAFLSEACKTLAGTSFCCVVDSGLSASAEDIFKQIISRLELAAIPPATLGEMLVVLRNAMSDTSFHRVVLVIDDADLLNDAIIASLLSLFQGAQGGQFHLLLSGNHKLMERLDKLEVIDVLIYDISLEPFSLEETTEYLQFTLQRLGKGSVDYFKDGEINAIYKRAKGFPVKINSAIQQALNANDSADVLEAHDSQHKTGLPLLHMGLLIVLLAGLIMLLIYTGDDTPTEANPVSVETLASPIVKEAKPDALELAIAELNAEKQQEQTSNQTLANSAEKVAQAPAEKTEVIAAVSTQQQEQTELLREKSKQAADTLKASDALKNTLKQELERESARLKAQAETSNTEKKADIIEKKDNGQPFSDDERLVLAQSDTDFTLQLIGAEQKESLERYIASQANASKLLLVSLIHNGKPWHVVVTGRYKTAQLARRGVQYLPKNQVDGGPWPKKVSDLKQGIHAFRRK